VRGGDAIPAVIYGKANGSHPIAIERKAFELAYRDHLRHAFYVLDLSGNERRTLIKDVQKHKLDGHIVHVDFFEFDPNRKTFYTVPVVTRGQSLGEKEGGILALVMQELKIRALPTVIPDKIVIDVTNITLNHTIRVRDLGVTAFEVIANPEDPIVAVVSPRGTDEARLSPPPRAKLSPRVPRAPSSPMEAPPPAKPADGSCPAAKADAKPAAK
jgi:large subunit ribosomal protein L25